MQRLQLFYFGVYLCLCNICFFHIFVLCKGIYVEIGYVEVSNSFSFLENKFVIYTARYLFHNPLRRLVACLRIRFIYTYTLIDKRMQIV
jgi:hypothetical protein